MSYIVSEVGVSISRKAIFPEHRPPTSIVQHVPSIVHGPWSQCTVCFVALQERSGVLSEEAQGRLDMMEAQLAEQQEAFAQEESRQEAARAQFLQEATQLEDNEGEGRNIIKFNEMHKHLKTWYAVCEYLRALPIVVQVGGENTKHLQCTLA